MSQSNHISKVTIVGASGRVGGAFAEALLKTGKHTVTALTRPDSSGTLPADVKVVQVNYDDEQSLVSALQGQQFLVITLSVRAPRDLHSKIVKAAVKADVPHIMPNIYGSDIWSPTAVLPELPLSETALGYCTEIENLGASYIAMICGFWYEWSLAIGEQWFGFTIKDRKVTFYDDGKTYINTSTWDQCGRALAALLSLPESGASPALADWKNKPLYIASWRISQRDMLDSLHRVLGTTDKDWTITYEPTAQRIKDGLAEMKSGQVTGFAKALYAHTMTPNGHGEYETSRGLANDVLGLPKEDLDEATRRAVKMVESGWNPFTN